MFTLGDTRIEILNGCIEIDATRIRVRHARDNHEFAVFGTGLHILPVDFPGLFAATQMMLCLSMTDFQRLGILPDADGLI